MTLMLVVNSIRKWGRNRSAAGFTVVTVFYWCFFAIVAAQPFRELAQDEEIRWFPALATWTRQGWQVTLHGQIFEPEKRPMISWLARRLLGFSSSELTDEERERFSERTKGFLADSEGGKRIRVRIAGQDLDLGRTGGDGYFRGMLQLPEQALSAGKLLRLPAVVLANGRAVSNEVPVQMAGPEGVSVVTDIDDTIKISNVLARHELLANTFLRPFQAVDGMAEVYQGWKTDDGVTFHYVSGSPWQLFPALSEFLETQGFPEGSWHLRAVRLTRLSARELLRSPDGHKRDAIEELLRRSPARTFILVGDSGERDPEIYGNIARAHSGRIGRIFIRDVTGEDPTSRRYRSAFKDLPPDLWMLFTKASELPTEPDSARR